MRACVGAISEHCYPEPLVAELSPEEEFFVKSERDLALSAVHFAPLAAEVKKYSQNNFVPLKALFSALESVGFVKKRKNYRFFCAFSEKAPH